VLFARSALMLLVILNGRYAAAISWVLRTAPGRRTKPLAVGVASFLGLEIAEVFGFVSYVAGEAIRLALRQEPQP